MIVNPGIRRFLGSAIQRLFNSASFYAPLTHTAVPQRAAPGTTATFTRATPKTVTNNDGYLVTLLAGEIGFPGTRRVDNLIRLGAAQSSTLAIAANVTMTLPAGAYQFSMGAGTGTATFSGTGGATGTLAASASGRVFVAKTITAGTLIVTGSAAILNDIQVVSMVAETDQTTIREYVSVGVESAPYYHGSFVDGVKCFPTDLAGNALPTAYTYEAVSLNGVAGTYVSTPDSVANSITGDIDIRVKAKPNLWTGLSATADLITKWNSGGNSFILRTQTNGQLTFFYSISAGTNSNSSTVSVSSVFSTGDTGWVRVTRSAASGTIIFYTSTDGVVWTQLGASAAGVVGLLDNNTAEVQVSGYSGAGDWAAQIYSAQIYNGIGITDVTPTGTGTLAVDFDASRYAGGTTLTGSTGETWTLQGNAVIHPTNNPMLGYLAEGARTNICLESQTIATAPWQIGNGIAVTADQYVAPDGTTTVDKLTALAGNTQHFWYQGLTTTVGAYTYSVYLRYVNNQWARIGIFDGAASYYAAFDILNGVVGSTVGPVTATAIEPMADGVTWRVSLTATIGASALSQIYLSVVNADDPSFDLWNAAGTEAIGAWGAQVELGSFATPYQPTTTGAVARNADVDQYPTTDGPIAAAGSIALDFTPYHAPSGTIALWGTYVDASNYTAILHDATNLIFRKRIAGSNYDATIANAFVSGTTYKVAATWGAAGTAIYLDGVAGTPHANTTAAQIAATMQVGADGNSLQQPGAGTTNLRIWQRQLSSPEGVAVTA